MQAHCAPPCIPEHSLLFPSPVMFAPSYLRRDRFGRDAKAICELPRPSAYNDSNCDAVRQRTGSAARLGCLYRPRAGMRAVSTQCKLFSEAFEGRLRSDAPHSWLHSSIRPRQHCESRSEEKRLRHRAMSTSCDCRSSTVQRHRQKKLMTIQRFTT